MKDRNAWHSFYFREPHPSDFGPHHIVDVIGERGGTARVDWNWQTGRFAAFSVLHDWGRDVRFWRVSPSADDDVRRYL